MNWSSAELLYGAEIKKAATEAETNASLSPGRQSPKCHHFNVPLQPHQSCGNVPDT